MLVFVSRLIDTELPSNKQKTSSKFHFSNWFYELEIDKIKQ